MKQMLRKLICLNLALIMLLGLLPLPAAAAEEETQPGIFYTQPASGTYRYGDSYQDLTVDIRSSAAGVTIRKIEWRNDAEEVLKEYTYASSSTVRVVRDTLSLNGYGKITGPGTYGYYCLVTTSDGAVYASSRAVITVMENKTPTSAEECWIEIGGETYNNLQGTQRAETWRVTPYWQNGELITCRVQLKNYQGGSIRTNIKYLSVAAYGSCLIEAEDGRAGLEAESQVSLQVTGGAAAVRGSAGQPAIRAGDSVSLSTRPDAQLRLYGGEGAHAAEALYTSSRYYTQISVAMPGDVLAVGGGVAAYASPRERQPYTAHPTTELYLGDSENTLQLASKYDKNAVAVHLKQTTVTVQYYDKTASGEAYQKAGEQVNAYGQPAALTPPEPAVWDGYMFAGWGNTQELEDYTTYYQTGSEYAFDADLSLYALREEIVTDGAVLMLDAGTGTIADKNLPKTTLTAKKEEIGGAVCGTFTLPDVKPDTYSKTFLGWSESGTLAAGELTGLYFAGQTVTLKDGTTLYAVYADAYASDNTTCVLLANGGAMASGAQGYVIDLTAAVEDRPDPKTLFTRPGCLLTGWNTVSDGSGIAYSDSVIRKASRLPGVLYAQWQELPESGVVYYGNGGSRDGDVPEAFWTDRPESGFADLGDQGFTRPYCTFLGWSTSPSGFPEETVEVPEGALVELYAVWCFTATASSGDFQWQAGPVQLGAESGAAAAGASGTGWSYDSRVFLNEDYTGGSIRTTNDLYLYIKGNVRVDAIECGGTCFIEFADDASLTVGGGKAYGITAKEVRVGLFGILTVSGVQAAVSGTVVPTVYLAEGADTRQDFYRGEKNTLFVGADAASAQTAEAYSGEKWMRIEGKTLSVTYVDGLSRETEQVRLIHEGVRIDRTPATQDGRTFMGWALNAQGSGVYYYEGGTYRATGDDVTFYAQWAKTGEQMIYLSAGSGTVDGMGSTTMQPGSDGLYKMPEATGSTLFLGWMAVPYDGAFPGWNKLTIPEFDRSRKLIEENALLWPGECYDLPAGTALVAVWNKSIAGDSNYHVCEGNGGQTQKGSPVALVYVYASDSNLITYIGMEREDYFLTGWKAADTGKVYSIGDAAKGAGAMRLSAQWQQKQPGAAMLYGGIGRMENGDSFLQSLDLNAEDTHGFLCAGYTFDGWYAYGETERAKTLEPGRAYLAKWTPYCVEYHDNGRVWKNQSPTVTKRTIALRAGEKIFDGWNTKADGSGEWVMGGTVLTSDLVLYAQYADASTGVLLYVAEGWFGGQNFRRIEPLNEYGFYELPETLDGQEVLVWCQYYLWYEKGSRCTRTTSHRPGKSIMQSGSIARAILPDGKAFEDGEILLCGNGGWTGNVDTCQIISTASFSDLMPLDKYAFTKTGAEQTGWNTAADGSGTAFALSVPAQDVAKSGEHILYAQWKIIPFTLTVDGRKYQLDRNDSRGGAGWTCERSGDTVWLELNGYQGGAITFSDGAERCLTIQITGENTITAEQTAAIEAPGFGEITFGYDDREATLRVTGSPAVRADATLWLRTGGLTLENPDGGEAAECAGISVDERICELKKTPGENGAAAKLETITKLYTLTLHGNGGTDAEGNDTVKLTARYGEACRYPELFSRENYAFVGWQTDPKEAGAHLRVWVTGDTELYAYWHKVTYPVTALFYDPINKTYTEVEVKDGSCTVPALPEDPSGKTQALYWYYEDGEDDEGAEHPCLPGDTLQLKTSMYYRAFTMGTDTCGIVFHPNGGTLSGHKRPSTNKGCRTTQIWNGLNGEQIISWNTKPDGTGTSYARYNAEVPGADEHWVVLFAQWVNEEDGVWYSFSNQLSQNDSAGGNWGRHGSTIQLPEPEYPEGVNVEFLGWREGMSDGTLYQPGESYTIPTTRSELLFEAIWKINETFTIDGKTYPYPTEMKRVFGSTLKTAAITGDGWEMTVWDTGLTWLQLTAYHGGAIDFPLSLNIDLYQETEVTGGNGQPAISCGGILSCSINCTREHASAALRGGSGAPALRAKEIQMHGGAHLVLTGGGVPALEGKISPYYGVGRETLYGGSGSTDLRQYSSWQAAADCTYLETRTRQYKVTIDGNGGTTADDKPSKTYTLNLCNYTYYVRGMFAEFTRPGYFLYGIEHPNGQMYSLVEMVVCFPEEDCVVKPYWIKTETDHTIAFLSGGLKDADIDGGDFGLFLRDNTTPPTAPEASFKEPYDQNILICWETEAHDDGTVRQYFPGELVYEPDNTVLYPMVWAMRGSCLMLLVGNGKTFSDGRRIQNSETASATAADGTQLLSWNTKPDGSGTSYPVGWSMSIEEAEARTEPLYLYAQWGPAFTATADKDSATGETILTIRPSAGMTDLPEDTDDKPFAEGVRIMLAAYQDGRFAGMVFAEAKNGEITCRLPSGLNYRTCELKLFFLKNGKPVRSAETIQIKS